MSDAKSDGPAELVGVSAAGRQSTLPGALAPEEHGEPWHDESVELVLKPRQWVLVGMVTLGLVLAIPAVAKRYEVFQPTADYRQPKTLSEDYWQYDRWLETVVRERRVLFLGDSVVWGEYARPSETITAGLNDLAGEPRYANGGLKGLHPLAMRGLAQRLLPASRLRGVVLHFNPIWMTSPQRDLQVDEEVSFNHPLLLPQLFASVPAYHATWDERIGAELSVRVGVWRWTRHQQMISFDRLDLPRWTLAHPERSPLSAWQSVAPMPLDEPSSRLVRRGGGRRREYAWVEPEESLQYRAFVELVEELRGRGCPVFCWVGALDAGGQTEASQAIESGLRGRLEEDLRSLGVAWAEAAVGSEEMADASHPTALGYREQTLALWQNPAFRAWCDELGE